MSLEAAGWWTVSNRCCYCLSHDKKVPVMGNSLLLLLTVVTSLAGVCSYLQAPGLVMYLCLSLFVLLLGSLTRGDTSLTRAFFIRTPAGCLNGPWPVNFCWVSALFNGRTFLLLFVFFTRKPHLRGYSVLSGTLPDTQLTVSWGFLSWFLKAGFVWNICFDVCYLTSVFRSTHLSLVFILLLWFALCLINSLMQNWKYGCHRSFSSLYRTAIINHLLSINSGVIQGPPWLPKTLLPLRKFQGFRSSASGI